MLRLFLCIAVLLCGARADAGDAPRTRWHLGVGVADPNDGALEEFWLPGPTLYLGRSLWHGAWNEVRAWSQYEYHPYSDEGSYATHGTRSTLAWVLGPGTGSGFELAAETGVGGFWTTDYEPDREIVYEVIAHPWFGPQRVDKLRGWGPVLGVTGAAHFPGERGTRFGIRVAWYRTWASDAHLESTTVGLYVGIP